MRPFTGPESRKWRKVYEQEQKRKSAAQIAAEQRAAEMAAGALVAEVARMRASGAIVNDDVDDDEIQTLPLAPALPTPTGWHPDPLRSSRLPCT